MLDKQIQVYSVDTSNFYSRKEFLLHNKIYKLKSEKKELKKKLDELKKSEKKETLTFEGFSCNGIIKHKTEQITKTKKKLLTLLGNKANSNIQSQGTHHKRILTVTDDMRSIYYGDIISIFVSSLSRMIGLVPDKLTDELIIVQVYYFDILKDIIHSGFEYKGQKYIYFTSSAGQIRNKKAVFIKEETFKKYEKTMMCGLTIDTINEKGGNNPNKHLAYLALNNSATDEWKEFNINKCIVVDDFETEVFGEYDFINDRDYSIKREKGYIPIPHTDGCGMILPNAFGKKQRNMMIRLPWMKGLLGVFDYLKFIEKNNCSSIVKDIYGVEHDVIQEDIQVIFTKSQFKMWKFYDSWDEYKYYYKEYKCLAGIANIESERISNKYLNYQMLQTLTDVTDKELKQLLKISDAQLNSVSKSIDCLFKLLNIDPASHDMTPLQKSILLYPNLVNDPSIKDYINNIRKSKLKDIYSGKIKIQGKYTFILPDLYAFCEYLFLQIKIPNGLLENKEIYCSLFSNAKKLDCLRSPHLYKEHAIRNNVAEFENTKRDLCKEWFTTKALYTSTKDLISKILQFDKLIMSNLMGNY